MTEPALADGFRALMAVGTRGRAFIAPLGTPPPGAPGSEGLWRELAGTDTVELAGTFADATVRTSEGMALAPNLYPGLTVRWRLRLTRAQHRLWFLRFGRPAWEPWPYASTRRDPFGRGRVAAKHRRQLAVALRRRDRRAARRRRG